MHKVVMAIGAHADDIEIYFGGTLLKYLDKGYKVIYIQSTNNMSGPVRTVQPDGSLKSVAHGPLTTMAYRKAECTAAATMFATIPIHLDHPQRHCHVNHDVKNEVRFGSPIPEGVTNNVPTILTAYEDAASVKRLADLMLEQQPEVIFTHGFVESNPEHYATALLVIAAYEKAFEQGCHGSLLHAVNGFKQLGNFNGQWETWVDISDYVDRRMATIQAHVSQYPVEFTEGAAYWRRILEARGKCCGVVAAEIFNFINTGNVNTDCELQAELLRNRAVPGTAWGPPVQSR